MEADNKLTLAEEFRQIECLCVGHALSIEAILDHLETRGRALLTLFLSLPFIFPIPLPGLSVPFGVFIFLFGLSLATEWKPWLPKSWLKKEMKRDLILKFCGHAQKVLRKLERFLKPRLAVMNDKPALRLVSGLMIAFCGFLLALPLPPGTNSPPAIAIVTLSLGLLERDGVFTLIGYVLFALNIAFFTALPMIGYNAVLRYLGVA